MDRRRALMRAKKEEAQWEDITASLTWTRGNYVDFATPNDTIRVVTTQNGTYRSIMANFTTDATYKYKVTCESVTVTTGAGKIGCRTSENVIVNSTATPTWTTSQGAIENEFSHDSTIAKISAFCTWSTSGAGNVTYAAFRLWRKKL